MNFEDVLPLMKKGIRCKCDGVYWTANEHHEWLRWSGSSFRIDPSGPSNDQILGGEWASEAQEDNTKTKLEKYGEAFRRCMTSNAPPADLSHFESRLRYLELLHKVQWEPDRVIPWPLADEADQHMKRGWL